MKLDIYRGITDLPMGTVFMDNFTVGSALDLVIPVRDERTMGPHRFPLMWDKAVSLLSLANLVESIVIHEKIYVDDDYAFYWMSREPSTVNLLKKVVSPMSLSDQDRRIVVNRAAQRTKALLHCFPAFWRGLVARGLMGMVITSGMNYYPGRHVTYQGQLIAEELDLDMGRDRLSIFSEDITDLLDSIVEVLGWREDYWYSRRPGYGQKNHGTIEGGNASELTLLGLRALAYDEMSRAFGRPYSPNILRSPFLFLDHAARHPARETTAKRAVQYIERISRERDSSISGFLAEDLLSIRMPLVFAAVVRESSGPDELLRVALEFRESAEARDFRRWVRELDEIREHGDLPQIREKIGQAQRQLDGLGDLIGQYVPTINLQIGLSPLILELPIRLPTRISRRIERLKLHTKLHMQFCHTLFDSAMAVAELEDRLEHLFRMDSTMLEQVWRLTHDDMFKVLDPLKGPFGDWEQRGPGTPGLRES